jgi:hypothetical protein
MDHNGFIKLGISKKTPVDNFIILRFTLERPDLCLGLNIGNKVLFEANFSTIVEGPVSATTLNEIKTCEL